ncbi:MAG: hypothetical protein GF311_21050 [Candidatus Lokiarchaeota archaeon]|nr:hypothetical protein [Candidatus Lokiarchaeota archaeon]
MSITPFSHSEIEALRTIFEEKGWSLNGYIENYFRYSLRSDKTLVLTVKFPVVLPIRLNIPFEIANFKISIVLKFWNLDSNTQELIAHLIKALRDFALNVSLDHDFPVKGKEKELVTILNEILPEIINNEKEKAWINRIRIALMNKREKFKAYENNTINNLVEELEQSGLSPTFDHPWELRNGIPKLRTSETLFFSNEESFDEFFILEKDFFTYFKDVEYKKMYIRTFFESYSPQIIQNVFQDEETIQLDSLVKNWIKFARLLLNSIINIISSSDFTKNILLSFRPERMLDSNQFIEESNNFPFSALHYESIIAKDLYPIHNDLLNRPPSTFEVIEFLNFYTEAEELINNYKFEKATEVLTEALKIFNKHKQRKTVVAILLFLKDIALKMNQDAVAINYLENALAMAKSGDVPLKYILKTHQELGKIYFDQRNLDKAKRHFEIILDFLENDSSASDQQEKRLGVASIYLGLIYQEEGKIPLSKNTFRKAFDLSSKITRIQLLYHLLRARFYKNRGKLSLAQKMLKMSLKNIEIDDIEEKNYDILSDLLMEIAEYYIHDRQDSKKAHFFLKKAKGLLDTKSIEGLRKSIRWSLLSSDFYSYLVGDKDKSQYYIKESQKLKNQLRSIGVEE